MTEEIDHIETLEERFKRFRMVGSPDVIIEGDIYHGYAVNVPQCGGLTEGPPTPIGACCFDDGTCVVTTQNLCESEGGTYLGDGTSCIPNPCGGGACGDNTTTLCKCGFTDCDTGTHYYLTSTVESNWDSLYTQQADGDPIEVCHNSASGIIYSESYTLDENYICNGPDTTVCEGTEHTKSLNIDGCGFVDEDCVLSVESCFCSNCWDYGRCLNAIAPNDPCLTHDIVCDSTSRTETRTANCVLGGPPPALQDNFTGTFTETTTYSDEYTTDMLIDNTVAKFASDFGDCPIGCVVTFILNEDESCCTAFCISA